MTAGFATRVEARAGHPMSPHQIFEVTSKREMALSRLLVAYVSAGLVFMLLPGTFLGVWNLISISNQKTAQAISPAWIQAHGHAQVFGWIGSFILGIGFYSIPKLRQLEPFGLARAWLCWAMWVAGVSLRWIAAVYSVYWRVLLPFSGLLELLAFLIFLRTVAGHRPEDSRKPRLESWTLVVIAGTLGFLTALCMNLFESILLATSAATAALTPPFDQKYLVVIAWAFMVPFVWGFSAKWLPVFLGLRETGSTTLLVAVIVQMAGVLFAVIGALDIGALLLLLASLLAIWALRLFHRTQQPAKIKGLHWTWPTFIRISYGWLIMAAVLGIWASLAANPIGVAGASRHALTVGFIAGMVFSIGQRVLPAFAGMKKLWSPRLMLLASSLLTIGCTLRVSCEVLAYQGYALWAWRILPCSAVIELSAVTAFALDMAVSFASSKASTQQAGIAVQASAS